LALENVYPFYYVDILSDVGAKNVYPFSPVDILSDAGAKKCLSVLSRKHIVVCNAKTANLGLLT